jgi:hypothetical protein
MGKPASRPTVPETVKLELRQEAGFGCCKCGRPVFEYHHIVEYADEAHFRPVDMMVLCPYCHDEATKGAMTIAEQRSHKTSPFNIRQGMSEGLLKINQDSCELESGSIRFIARGDILRVDGEPLLALRKDAYGALELSVSLYDRDDRLLVRIVRNEWIADEDPLPWDIEADFQYLRIRSKKRDIRLEIDARSRPIALRANLWRKGQNIELSPKHLSFKASLWSFANFIFDGLVFDVNSRTNEVSFGPVTETYTQRNYMATLLAHRDVVFEHETVYLAGNAYIGCTFRCCTMIAREGPTHLDRCIFDSCVWHLDLIVHDAHAWEEFVQAVGPMIGRALPRIAADAATNDPGV